MHVHIVQCVKYAKLQTVTSKQKWEQKTQSFPHPGMEALNGNIHGVTFAQRSQPIQTTVLIIILKKL